MPILRASRPASAAVSRASLAAAWLTLRCNLVSFGVVRIRSRREERVT